MEYPNRLIEKVFRQKYAKNLILFILICLFAYSFAGALNKVMAERTLGSIFRNFLQTIPWLSLIVLISLYDIRRFPFPSLVFNFSSNVKRELSFGKLLLIIPLVVITGLFVSEYIIHMGLLYGPVIFAVFISLLVSCYYVVTERKILGVIIFLLVQSFLFFIHVNRKEIGFEQLIIYEAHFSLSAIYLFTISMFFFLGKYKSKVSNVGVKERMFIKLCMAFVLIPIFSIILSKDPIYSFIFYLMDMVLPFVYFLILLESIKNIEDIKKVIFYFVISIFLWQVFGLYRQGLIGSIEDITLGLHGSRATHVGFKVTYISLTLPFAVTLYYLMSGWKKAFMLVLVLFFLVYLMLSNSRSVLVGALGGFIIFFYYYRINIFKKLYFLVLGLVCMFILIIYWVGFFEILKLHRIFESWENFFKW